MKELSTQYEIIELSKYTTPIIKEAVSKEWIEYGVDNNYFQYLIDRYTGSTTNNAIINGIARMIYGKGIDALDSRRKPDEYAQMLSIFKKDDLRQFIIDRKMLGMGSWQITYKGKKVKSALHFPMNTLRAEKANKDGEIEAWYYHPKWAELEARDKPKRIPSFGFGNKKENEIFVLAPYVPSYWYYSPPEYNGAIPYAVLEEEISDYLINDTINGFSGTKVINFNNGVPDSEEARIKAKNKVIRKLTGARGEKIIVAFNANAESATTMEDVPLNNAPEHYQYLSDECRNKLIMGHSITNPILVGVREAGGGLGNNADELKTASLFLHNTTIKPFQDEIIDAMDEILAVNNIALKLYFKTLEPLEFIEVEGLDPETKEEETGIKMCSHKFSTDEDNKIASELIGMGEDLPEDWELIDERDVDYDFEEYLDQEIDELNEQDEKSLLKKIWNFISTGRPRAGAKSSQDEKVGDKYYFVRYIYHPKKISANSREFCIAMVNAAKLYRKEDIIKMDNSVVNAGWGLNGADKYSIWLKLYKGGGACHHRWRRQTFVSNKKTNVRGKDARPIGTRAAEIRGYTVKNPWQVSVRPTDMPNQGFVNK